MIKKTERKTKYLATLCWALALGAVVVATVVASFRGLYGMFQVWTGEITSVPIIGKLMYPSDTDGGTGLLISFFEVGFGGLAYLFMWVTPAGMALVVLAFVTDRIGKRGIEVGPGGHHALPGPADTFDN